MLAGAASRSGNFLVAAQRGGRRVIAYNRELTQKLFDLDLSADTLLSLSIADIDRSVKKT